MRETNKSNKVQNQIRSLAGRLNLRGTQFFTDNNKRSLHDYDLQVTTLHTAVRNRQRNYVQRERSRQYKQLTNEKVTNPFRKHSNKIHLYIIYLPLNNLRLHTRLF